MEEIWKTVIYQGKQFPNFEVSNHGNFRNANTKKVYSQWVNKKGYCQVCVSLGGRSNKKTFKIHKAVAETFISNPENKLEVNHIDADKTNNNVNNLEWVTGIENSRHAKDNGLMKTRIGEDSLFAKLTESDVRYIINNYRNRDKKFGCRALAKKFGVDHSAISRIINGKNWKHISRY